MIRIEELADAVRREDTRDVLALASQGASRVVRYLSGRLYSADADEKWRAVRLLGLLVREPDLLTDSKVADLLHRFLWALNDESGAVPFGVPEAIGEILAERRVFRPEILPVLCGMLSEEDTFQTGAIERGIYWALGRIGPDVLNHCAAVAAVVTEAAQHHPDSDTRATAARALAALGRKSHPE